MTTGEWLKDATSRLTKAGIASAHLDAELILCHVLKISKERLLAHDEETFSDFDKAKLNRLLASRLERQPLVHLLGIREFYGLDMEITPAVLTPRAETETMVEAAIIQAPKDGSLLDVGTGSGAIAIAIAKHRPDLAITATDLSKEALDVANRNAKKHKTEIKLIKSDLLKDVGGQFDVITANLPYLRNDVELLPEVAYEPTVALLGGPDGLDVYRRFFGQVPRHLNPGGLVFIEADPWQHQDLIKIASKTGLSQRLDDYFIVSFESK